MLVPSVHIINTGNTGIQEKKQTKKQKNMREKSIIQGGGGLVTCKFLILFSVSWEPVDNAKMVNTILPFFARTGK